MTETKEQENRFVAKKEADNLERAKDVKEDYEGKDRMEGWPYPYTKGAQDKLMKEEAEKEPRKAGEAHSFVKDKIADNLERAEDVKEDYEGKDRMKGWPYPYTKGARDRLMKDAAEKDGKEKE